VAKAVERAGAMVVPQAAGSAAGLVVATPLQKTAGSPAESVAGLAAGSAAGSVAATAVRKTVG